MAEFTKSLETLNTNHKNFLKENQSLQTAGYSVLDSGNSLTWTRLSFSGEFKIIKDENTDLDTYLPLFTNQYIIANYAFAPDFALVSADEVMNLSPSDFQAKVNSAIQSIKGQADKFSEFTQTLEQSILDQHAANNLDAQKKSLLYMIAVTNDKQEKIISLRQQEEQNYHDAMLQALKDEISKEAVLEKILEKIKNKDIKDEYGNEIKNLSELKDQFKDMYAYDPEKMEIVKLDVDYMGYDIFENGNEIICKRKVFSGELREINGKTYPVLEVQEIRINTNLTHVDTDTESINESYFDYIFNSLSPLKQAEYNNKYNIKNIGTLLDFAMDDLTNNQSALNHNGSFNGLYSGLFGMLTGDLAESTQKYNMQKLPMSYFMTSSPDYNGANVTKAIEDSAGSLDGDLIINTQDNKTVLGKISQADINYINFMFIENNRVVDNNQDTLELNIAFKSLANFVSATAFSPFVTAAQELSLFAEIGFVGPYENLDDATNGHAAEIYIAMMALPLIAGVTIGIAANPEISIPGIIAGLPKIKEVYDGYREGGTKGAATELAGLAAAFYSGGLADLDYSKDFGYGLELGYDLGNLGVFSDVKLSGTIWSEKAFAVNVGTDLIGAGVNCDIKNSSCAESLSFPLTENVDIGFGINSSDPNLSLNIGMKNVFGDSLINLSFNNLIFQQDGPATETDLKIDLKNGFTIDIEKLSDINLKYENGSLIITKNINAGSLLMDGKFNIIYDNNINDIALLHDIEINNLTKISLSSGTENSPGALVLDFEIKLPGEQTGKLSVILGPSSEEGGWNTGIAAINADITYVIENAGYISLTDENGLDISITKSLGDLGYISFTEENGLQIILNIDKLFDNQTEAAQTQVLVNSLP
jgi:hypothetical protein